MSFRLGLVGENISSSLSPILFSWAFQNADAPGSYTLFDFPRRLARSFFTNARVDWDGLNVTAPHKDLAFTLCDELSETARTARAVNTLVRKQSKLIGHNTDVAGFRFALERRLEQVDRVERVLMIGTGGAARACLVGMAQLAHPKEICIASRKPAEAIVKLDGVLPVNISPTVVTISNAKKRLPDFDLIIQATPVGHFSRPGFAIEPPLTFKRGALVFDLIYSPRKTLFLEAAQAFDCQTENGLVMLLAQAAESFQIWTGKPFPLELALRDLLPELQKS
ncbi:shikimate dehydrogenase [bacterium]|nr:shikimate dehydrogenase [bacterium]